MDNRNIEKMIGKRIQKIRKSKGYTQQQFAELVGLSTNYISELERGVSSPRLDKLVTIINTLECTADDIFSDVINSGYKIKTSRLSEMLDSLPNNERERAFVLLESFISSYNNL